MSIKTLGNQRAYQKELVSQIRNFSIFDGPVPTNPMDILGIPNMLNGVDDEYMLGKLPSYTENDGAGYRTAANQTNYYGTTGLMNSLYKYTANDSSALKPGYCGSDQYYVIWSNAVSTSSASTMHFKTIWTPGTGDPQLTMVEPIVEEELLINISDIPLFEGATVLYKMDSYSGINYSDDGEYCYISFGVNTIGSTTINDIALICFKTIEPFRLTGMTYLSSEYIRGFINQALSDKGLGGISWNSKYSGVVENNGKLYIQLDPHDSLITIDVGTRGDLTTLSTPTAYKSPYVMSYDFGWALPPQYLVGGRYLMDGRGITKLSAPYDLTNYDGTDTHVVLHTSHGNLNTGNFFGWSKASDTSIRGLFYKGLNTIPLPLSVDKDHPNILIDYKPEIDLIQYNGNNRSNITFDEETGKYLIKWLGGVLARLSPRATTMTHFALELGDKFQGNTIVTGTIGSTGDGADIEFETNVIGLNGVVQINQLTLNY